MADPTVREVPADELAEWPDVETARDMLLHPGGYGRSLLALASDVVVRALDERGRERDAARAEVERLRVETTNARAELQRLWAIEQRAHEALDAPSIRYEPVREVARHILGEAP